MRFSFNKMCSQPLTGSTNIRASWYKMKFWLKQRHVALPEIFTMDPFIEALVNKADIISWSWFLFIILAALTSQKAVCVWFFSFFFYLTGEGLSLNAKQISWLVGTGERWWQNTFCCAVFRAVLSAWCSVPLSLCVLLHCGPFSCPSLGPLPLHKPSYSLLFCCLLLCLRPSLISCAGSSFLIYKHLKCLTFSVLLPNEKICNITSKMKQK